MTKAIHPDFNVKPKDYKHLDENELLVTSIFYTIQGEGPYGGHAACFVRLAGCNLGGKGVNGAGCEFCDTRFYYKEGNRKTFDEVITKVKEEIKKVNIYNNCNLIVLTGGEPMVQKNMVGFIKYANSKGFDIQIESNGTLFQPNLPKRYCVTDTTKRENYLVVSPKLGGATNYPELRDDIFQRADCLKFVVEADPNGKYHQIPNYAFEFSKTGKPVYISPINVYQRDTDIGEITDFFDSTLFDHEKSKLNYQYAAQVCQNTGFILNLQKHIFTAIP